jgi:hypothetical protein
MEVEGVAMRWRFTRATSGLALLLVGCLGASCVGLLGEAGDDEAAGSDGSGSGSGGGDGSGGGVETPSEEALSEIGETMARRLTAAEYDATVRDLLGVASASSSLLLPEDKRTPYDNDYTLQLPSEALIAGAELLAGDIASIVSADPDRVADLLPCEPTGPGDEACFAEFLRSFGRSALRRTPTEDEIVAWSALVAHGEDAGDFAVAVDSAIRLFLQHPELLYRVEIGEPVPDEPGVFRLTPNEIATRIAYLTWGSTPPVWLLDAADGDALEDDEGIRTAAADMLDDDRARGRIARFHSLWMGYEDLKHAPDLAAAMQAETRALIDRVVFEDGAPWTDLLRAEETFIDATLADHYGLPSPGDAPGWVAYPAAEGAAQRQGLLSHGAFLSSFAKYDDSSPTQRGILVRTRLFCLEVERPPPGVDTDTPPTTDDPDACKEERYAQHREGGCASCHDLLDPVGFGLENYDNAGRFRTTEDGRPECSIDGQGNLDEVGTFSGPAELATLMIQAGGLEQCVVTQLYRFAMGRYELADPDEAFIERLVEDATATGELRFADVLLDMVSAPAFRFRREPEAE